MTNESPIRRDVLKTAGGATIISTVPQKTEAVTSAQTAMVIEAGIMYECPDLENIKQSVQNSRPPYTVDPANNQLLITASKAPTNNIAEQIAEAGALIAEQPVGPGESRGLSNSETVTSLPIALTARMRPQVTASLENRHKLPEVKINRNGRQAKLITKEDSTYQILPKTGRRIRLETEAVKVCTVEITDEAVEMENIPEYRRANKTVYGTKEINVTPIIEVINHGELDLVEKGH